MASGTTHWRSDLSPFSTAERLLGWSKITGNKSVCGSVTATDARAKRKVNAPIVQSTSYIKLGTAQYLFFGVKGTAATIIAVATALVGGTIAGSLYVGGGGKPGLWLIKSTSVASKLEGY